jgi:regulator of sirC expression with transglutaminase-like and TPR domain
MISSSTQSRFKTMVSRAEGDLNLAEAALLIASAEYPGLEVSPYLFQLDRIADAIQQRVPSDSSYVNIVHAMNEYLFEQQGFSGNLEDYSDPRNSYLNEVLDRKRGIPITLSVIYMEIGWRLGIPLEGVSFPGHFLVKFPYAGGEVVLDPFFKGISLSAEVLERRIHNLLGGDVPAQDFLPHLLVPATKKETLVRMLRNLKAIYVRQEDFGRALWCTDLILIVIPDTAAEIRDRGELFAQMECYRAAVADYTRYLELEPEAEDAAVLRTRLIELLPLVSRLN